MNDEKKLYIYIDLTDMISRTFLSGVQRVVQMITAHLLENQTRHNICIVLLRWDNGKQAYQVLDNEHFLRGIISRRGVFYCDSGQLLLPEQMRKGSIFFDVDSVWQHNPPRYYLYSLLKGRDVKIVVFIHDIIPVTDPRYFKLEFIERFLPYLDAAVAYSDVIFTTTQFTANEIRRIFAASKRKLPQFALASLGSDFGVCDKSNQKISPEARSVSKLAPYLLTVATIEPRKNHKVILDAYDRYLKNTNINLVFCGRCGWNTKALIKRIHSHKDYGKRIFHLMDQNDETVSYLYQEAFYTVLPTYIEGFGLPAVESLIAGTPALLSDIPVMHEVAGEYAQYFAPDSSEQLAELVQDGLSNPQSYNERRAAIASYIPITWQDCGEQIVQGLLGLSKALDP